MCTGGVSNDRVALRSFVLRKDMMNSVGPELFSRKIFEKTPMKELFGGGSGFIIILTKYVRVPHRVRRVVELAPTQFFLPQL